MQAGRYAHAPQFKRMRKAVKKPRSYMLCGGSLRFSTAVLRSGEYPNPSSYPARLKNRGKEDRRTTYCSLSRRISNNALAVSEVMSGRERFSALVAGRYIDKLHYLSFMSQKVAVRKMNGNNRFITNVLTSPV